MNRASSDEAAASSDDIPLAQVRTQAGNDDLYFKESLEDGSDDSFNGQRRQVDAAQRANRKAAFERRRKRLLQNYNEQYVELFRETFSNGGGDGGIPYVEFPETQLGAVIWTSDEKRKLYEATTRKGRLDIPSIAKVIGSKSHLEVQDYLSFIRKEEGDSHLLARHLKAVSHQHSISHADIPAAAEISEACELALEKAADALAAKQDSFDTAATVATDDAIWIINATDADALDAEADEEEEEQTFDTEESSASASSRLFQLSTLLRLSDRLFMNAGGINIEKHWRVIAPEAESPALTNVVVSDLYELSVSLTRRLMQAALFLAQSRLRSLRVQGKQAQSVVKRQDVIAALDVLGIDGDLWVYWIGVARRNKLNVIADSHKKGVTRGGSLPYDAVEASLAVRTIREYRKSQSMTTDASSMGNSMQESDFEVTSSKDEHSETRNQPGASPPAGPTSDDSGSTCESFESSTSSSEMEESEVDDQEGLPFHAITSTRKRRQMLLDRKQDRFLERLDKSASHQEEVRLWKVLGQKSDDDAKGEQGEGSLGRRPRVLGKTRDELQDWANSYEAAWEQPGGLVLEEDFAETERQRKRRKVEPYRPEPHQGTRLPLR